jgi:hypothetical protein
MDVVLLLLFARNSRNGWAQTKALLANVVRLLANLVRNLQHLRFLPNVVLDAGRMTVTMLPYHGCDDMMSALMRMRTSLTMPRVTLLMSALLQALITQNEVPNSSVAAVLTVVNGLPKNGGTLMMTMMMRLALKRAVVSTTDGLLRKRRVPRTVLAAVYGLHEHDLRLRRLAKAEMVDVRCDASLLVAAGNVMLRLMRQQFVDATVGNETLSRGLRVRPAVVCLHLGRHGLCLMLHPVMIVWDLVNLVPFHACQLPRPVPRLLVMLLTAVTMLVVIVRAPSHQRTIPGLVWIPLLSLCI